MSIPWFNILCKSSQIRLDVVLSAGQSFRWHEVNDKEWIGVLQDKVWSLRQDEQGIQYRVYEPAEKPKLRRSNDKCLSRQSKNHEGNSSKKFDGHASRYLIKSEPIPDLTAAAGKVKHEHENLVAAYEAILRDYFQLDVDLEDLYIQWSDSDPNFSKVAKTFNGIRTLRQDPVENLFSFICSSNNNIPRITSMVEKMCTTYGHKLVQVDGIEYYSFPSVVALAGSKVEQELRTMGFGYRAKFINKSAKYILENGGEKWLHSLRNVGYEEARAALCELPGVGPKVADCVCLMSLDKPGSIPIDTHVWQITAKYYMPSLMKTKTLTEKLYKNIGNHYRMLFGKYAGWAHSVLFSADLKRFQDLHSTLPAEEQDGRRQPNKRSKSTKPDLETSKKAKKEL